MSSVVYTDKMIGESFGLVANGFEAVDKTLGGIQQWMYHIEGHLAELGKKPVEVVVKKMPKSRKALPFLVGAGVGIYLYKKYSQDPALLDLRRKVSDNTDRVAEDLKKKASANVNGQNPDA